MTVTEAIAAIRAATSHDSPDTSVTDAQITQWLDFELRLLMREIAIYAPVLMTAQTSGTITSAASPTITKPADFGSVYLVERQYGAYYYPLSRCSDLTRNIDDLGWTETPANIEIAPSSGSLGTYRITYTKGPATGYTTLDLPAGCEMIVIHRAAAHVRIRFDESPDQHYAIADRFFKKMMTVLAVRTGMHSESALRRER